MSDPNDPRFLAAFREALRFDQAETPDPEVELAALRTRLDGGERARRTGKATGIRSALRRGRIGADTEAGRKPFGVSPLRRRAMTFSIVGVVTALLAIVIAGTYHAIARQHPVTSRTYATNVGQRATVTLSDGSTVVLAPQTRLRYSVDEAGASVVDLVGEALFIVKQQASRPFVVRTGFIITHVLGTTFDVRRYPEDGATQVTVVHGRVATTNRRRSVVLAPGMIGRIADSSVTFGTTRSDSTTTVAWMQDRLIFADAPVPVVLAALSRWYGYEFHLADSALASRNISAAFRTDHVAGTMNMLKAVLGVTMTFDGKVVTLRLERGSNAISRDVGGRRLLSKPEREVGK